MVSTHNAQVESKTGYRNFMIMKVIRSIGNKAISLILVLLLCVANAWGETETKTERFETANASIANSVNANKTLTTEDSDCGIGWKIYYGNIVSTSAAINGHSCLMQYTSANSGYAETTTPIKGLTNISFNAKVTNANIRMSVEYYKGGPYWTNLVASQVLTTSSNNVSYDIPNSSPTTDYYVRIGIASGNTNGTYLIIDDVVFTYTASNEVTVEDGQTLAIDEATEMDKLTIEAGGKVSGEAALTVGEMTLKSSLGAVSGTGNTNGKCGEIANRHITATGDVFFELDLTPAAEASYGWYAFSVPFAVSTTEGIYFGATKLTNESDYTIMAYHGDIRAQGQYAWKKHSGTLQPGVLYIISVADTDYKTLRFKKTAEAPLYNDVADGGQMDTQEYPASNPGHAGWNGLGNPYMETAHIGSVDLQFLDHEANAFKLRSGDNVNLMVGSAFFYQSDGSAITITKEKSGSIDLAPARTPRAIEQTTYEIRLLNAEGAEGDKLFLRTGEDETNSYTIGRDLAKMSMGDARCAQLWVPAYGMQLCAAAFPLENGQASYPLTLYAPAASEYAISYQPSAVSDQVDLYLTYQGAILWNLSESAYPIELAKGITEGYGLLLKEKKMPTGVEEKPTSDSSLKGRASKLILDGRVLILRGGKRYGVLGVEE